jgi:hypothetical protein
MALVSVASIYFFMCDGREQERYENPSARFEKKRIVAIARK